MTKKLLDFFPELLVEASAGEEAKKRGLKSIGFGRYVDPSDPKKVVAKSENGKLVSVGSGEKSDIGAAKKQVRDIEKRNNPQGEKRDQHKMLSNIFGKSVRFNKSVNVGGQIQMWWKIEDPSASPSKGLSGAFMNNKGQQWQRNKLAKIKKATATNPELAGWQPVFRTDRNFGGVVNLIMVKE